MVVFKFLDLGKQKIGFSPPYFERQRCVGLDEIPSTRHHWKGLLMTFDWINVFKQSQNRSPKLVQSAKSLSNSNQPIKYSLPGLLQLTK